MAGAESALNDRAFYALGEVENAGKAGRYFPGERARQRDSVCIGSSTSSLWSSSIQAARKRVT